MFDLIIKLPFVYRNFTTLKSNRNFVSISDERICETMGVIALSSATLNQLMIVVLKK